jgi:hypothetical protein
MCLSRHLRRLGTALSVVLNKLSLTDSGCGSLNVDDEVDNQHLVGSHYFDEENAFLALRQSIKAKEKNEGGEDD